MATSASMHTTTSDAVMQTGAVTRRETYRVRALLPQGDSEGARTAIVRRGSRASIRGPEQPARPDGRRAGGNGRCVSSAPAATGDRGALKGD